MSDQHIISDHDDLISWLQNASISSTNIPSNDITHPDHLNVHHLSRFEPHSSSPRRQVNDGEVRSSEDVVKTSNEVKTRKKRRSNEVHNLKERKRRQKLSEKVYTIQEMIPNCYKGDTASILDEAAKYMITLQYQIQMISMEAGIPVFYSPLMPQPGLQEMQIPCLGLFPQTGSLGGGTGIGAGMSSPLFDFPMSQFGLPDEHLLAPLATSTLPASAGIPAAAHSIQYSGNVLESMPSATSSMDLEALYATFSGFPIGGDSGPLQVARNNTMESRPSVDVISDFHSTSTLPAAGGIPAATHSVQYQGNVLESLPSSTSSMDLEALYATLSEFKFTIGGESVSSEGTPSSAKEVSPSF